MANRIQLKQIALSRLQAARTLYNSRDYDGSIYIAGYAIELALKAVICKRLNLTEYPDSGSASVKDDMAKIFRTHNLDILLVLSGMSNDINLTSTNTRLFENWSDLTKWKPDLRYEPIGTYANTEAQRMIEALEEKPNGVLTWIRRNKKW